MTPIDAPSACSDKKRILGLRIRPDGGINRIGVEVQAVTV